MSLYIVVVGPEHPNPHCLRTDVRDRCDSREKHHLQVFLYGASPVHERCHVCQSDFCGLTSKPVWRELRSELHKALSKCNRHKS